MVWDEPFPNFRYVINSSTLVAFKRSLTLTMWKVFIQKQYLQDPCLQNRGKAIHMCDIGTEGALRYRAAPALHISRMKGSFLRPLHVCDFVKGGYFFEPRYEVGGGGG